MGERFYIRLKLNEIGQSLLEYELILSIVSIAAVVSLIAFGEQVSEFYNDVLIIFNRLLLK